MYQKTLPSLLLLMLLTCVPSTASGANKKTDEGCSLSVIFVALIGGIAMGSGMTALVTFYIWRYNQMTTLVSYHLKEEGLAEHDDSLTTPVVKKKIRPSAMIHSVPKSCEVFNMDNLDNTVMTQLGHNPPPGDSNKDKKEVKENNSKKKPRKVKNEAIKKKIVKKEPIKVAADVDNVEADVDGDDLKRSDKKKRNTDRK